MPHLQLEDASLFYSQAGQTGPRTLWIQGVGCIGNTWKPQVEDLAADHQTLCFDNRGIGQSTSTSASPLTVDQMTSDTLALLDACGWQTCHVIGHSLGGCIAQRLAARAPQRVQSLTLMCTVARGAEATALRPRMLWLGTRSRVGPANMRRRAFAEMIFPKSYLQDRLNEEFLAEMAALFGHDLAVALPIVDKQLGALRKYDGQADMAKLKSIPVFILSGAHDPIAVPEAVQRLHSLLPHGEWVQDSDASHALPVQKPAYVNGLLRRFLADRGRAAAPS